MRIVIPNADFSNNNIGRLVPEHEEWSDYYIPNAPTVCPWITSDEQSSAVLKFYYSSGDNKLDNINQSCACINVEGKNHIKAQLSTKYDDYLYGCVAFSSSEIVTVPNGDPANRIDQSSEVGKTINLVQMADGKYSKHIDNTNEFVVDVPQGAKYVIFCYRKNQAINRNLSIGKTIEEHIEEV